MIDPTLEAWERKLLALVHPYGCTTRTLITTGKAKPGQIQALVDRRLIVRDRPGTVELTDHGRAALGVTTTKET